MRRTGGFSFPRRQQYRRLSRAARAALASCATMLVALTTASAGAIPLAVVLLMPALGFGL